MKVTPSISSFIFNERRQLLIFLAVEKVSGGILIKFSFVYIFSVEITKRARGVQTMISQDRPKITMAELLFSSYFSKITIMHT